jgi:hypothetical protein
MVRFRVVDENTLHLVPDENATVCTE